MWFNASTDLLRALVRLGEGRKSPWWILSLCKDTLLQQSNDFAREVAKVNKDALFNFQVLELLLTDFQSVQEKEVFFTGEMNSEYLQHFCL